MYSFGMQNMFIWNLFSDIYDLMGTIVIFHDLSILVTGVTDNDEFDHFCNYNGKADPQILLSECLKM